MPAHIIDGVINFLSSQLEFAVWDGEVPRYGESGEAIYPLASSSPSVWPVIKVTMPEAGFDRTWTTEDPYDDNGNLLVEIWATTREDCEDTADLVEALLAQAVNWAQINLGGPQENPYYVVQMLLVKWASVQEEGERTQESLLIYRCDLHYEVMIHGATPTT